MKNIKALKVDIKKTAGLWGGVVRILKIGGYSDTIKLPRLSSRKAVYDVAFKALKAYDK